MQGGSLANVYTSVEGLLTRVRDQFVESNPFTESVDSSTQGRRATFTSWVKRFNDIIAGQAPFTLILHDPMASSWIYSPYAPHPDPRLEVRSCCCWFRRRAAGAATALASSAAVGAAACCRRRRWSAPASCRCCCRTRSGPYAALLFAAAAAAVACSRVVRPRCARAARVDCGLRPERRGGRGAGAA